MEKRKRQLQEAMQQAKEKKGFGYFLKLSGNPQMKRIKGRLTAEWENFLIKNKSNEK